MELLLVPATPAVASGPRALSCREFVDFLWRFLEDDVTPAERAVFERHAASCPSCAAYLVALRQAVDLGRAAFRDDSLPADVPAELVEAVLAAKTAPI